MRSRVILDANLLVSYLLDPRLSERTVNRVVEAAYSNAYTLVVPRELLDEVRRVIETKPYIRARVDPGDRDQFIELLGVAADEPGQAIAPRPSIVRDPNDNYLLAAAQILEVDFVVSGDNDLLALKERVEDFRILSPREFLDFLGG